jgi:methionyl-tRNA synthetase
MSKSRGNFLDPLDVVAALGADGARYASLREVAFDRDTEVSWDSFVRRYNADLANNFGNLVNRTVSMANRYLGGERPAATSGPLSETWATALPAYVERLEACRLDEAIAGLWDFVDAANRFVEARQPWTLAKEAKAGDAARAEELRGVLGDLVEACRLIGLAIAPYMPAAAPRVLAQLGYDYPYQANGNGGPALLSELGWGGHAGEIGRLAAPEPLFPRIEVEAETAAG